MSLFKIRAKGQITLPVDIRRGLNLKAGDMFEAEVKNGKIVLTPKRQNRAR